MDCGNSYCCLSAPGSYLGACIFGFHNFVRLRCCSARKPGRPCALVFIPNSRRLLLVLYRTRLLAEVQAQAELSRRV